MAGLYQGVRRPSRQTTFFILMAASATLLLLPRDILGPARGMSALIAIPQWMATEASRGVADPLMSLGMPAITAQEHAELVSRLEALRNENASLAIHMAEAQAKISELTRVRENGFPSQGKLIPARVIAGDAVAARGSLRLSKGKLSSVKAGDWVTSRRFVDAGEKDGVRQGAGVLARETLIGWVEEADTFTSRVVLLSDNFSVQRIMARIERFNPKKNSRLVVTLNGAPARFALEGAGRGIMVIHEIDAGSVEKGVIQVGDIVTSDPNDSRLPVAMVIGEITALEKVRDDKKKPLFYTAHVKHRYDPASLGQVFVADFSPETQRPPAARQ